MSMMFAYMMLLLTALVHVSFPAVTTMILAGPLSRLDSIRSLKSLLFGSTVGTIAVTSFDVRLGRFEIMTGFYKQKFMRFTGSHT